MKILQLVAENFKKIRVVEIKPDGNLVALTGRNGQGKTSVLDAIWFLLKGKAALPAKAVRKGAEKLKVWADFGAFTVTRTMTEGGLPTLNVEMAKGQKRDTTPQDFLDKIFGMLTFDPLEFIRMETAEQVEMLQKVAGVDSAVIAKLDEENAADYETRTGVNREMKALNIQCEAIETLAGLPKEKVDEAAILTRLNEAGELNRQAQDIFRAKQDLGAKAAQLGVDIANYVRTHEAQENKIALLEEEVKKAKNDLKRIKTERAELEVKRIDAEKAFKAAPAGDPIDVAALTAELQAAQRTNRAIDTRTRKEELVKQWEAKKQESEKLKRAMDARDEKKRELLTTAKIPVDGLVFDERQVLYKGLPLDNLGEGEQIRISTEIGMAANPELRVLMIRHGEALDEDGMKILAKMAKENDFQIWMAKVDSSGKVGIVLEDGMVVARNGEAE
jgi:DNA repair exonuclease SbcCD ATPase subunit